MKLATWNVNSLKVRLPQVLQWLADNEPEVLCLQETKLQDENFPQDEIAAAGYEVIYSGQKTYNGVAILSKQTGSDRVAELPDFDDEQKRVIAATFNDIRIICIYIPNGDNTESEKYNYKLNWLAALNQWLKRELAEYPKLVLLGDYNIAPEDRDIYDPEKWRGQVLCSQPERDAFQGLCNLGLIDSFNLFDQSEKSYTWWDYRMMAFRRNRGARIDHILLSGVLKQFCTRWEVDKSMRKLERPSDHAPVSIELTL